MVTPVECIFCQIANKKQDSNILYESDNILIIQDIMPKAPIHVLILPKKHIMSVNELTEDDGQLITEMILSAKNYAREIGVAEKGYKLVFNTGKEGGQVIFHLHLHLLAGKQLDA